MLDEAMLLDETVIDAEDTRLALGVLEILIHSNDLVTEIVVHKQQDKNLIAHLTDRPSCRPLQPFRWTV
jgi:hypothetical protein